MVLYNRIILDIRIPFTGNIKIILTFFGTAIYLFGTSYTKYYIYKLLKFILAELLTMCPKTMKTFKLFIQ